MKFMRYIYNLLIAIDQLGNVIAGGFHDTTISARVGFFAQDSNSKGLAFWKLLERIINFTFFPLDGPGHCLQSYLEDKDECFHAGSTVAYVFLSLFIVIFTPIIALILYTSTFLFPSLKEFNNDVNKCNREA